MELLGPAVIIDDQIGSSDDKINDLIKKIEENHIPYLAYKELPSEGIIQHLSGISFLLLDWKLQQTPAGVSISDDALYGESIEFLKKLREKTFIPIFIFTTEELDSVKEMLSKSGLYDLDGKNLIFVEDKRELIDGNLFPKITEWIKGTPSVYVLKEWEKEYEQSKANMFNDFYQLSHSWPKILWGAYKDDSVDPSYGLGEVITRNLHTRMAPFEFDGTLLESTDPANQEEIRRVLSGERYIESEGGRLKLNAIASGDVFKFQEEGSSKSSYYINIRPDCDCISRDACALDDLSLYLLKLRLAKPNSEKKCYSEKFGNFEERDTNAFIFSMHKNKSFEVQFKDLRIKSWGELKESRIGRLLPPYITRIQQRYSLYLQRQGLPRTPREAVFAANEPNEADSG